METCIKIRKKRTEKGFSQDYTNAEQICKINNCLLQRITTSKQLLLRISVKN